MDQDKVVRARLFDILLGDWDRHIGQWKWARFQPNGKTIWKPIPRDRDQAFVKFDDGVIPWVASRGFALRLLQSFNEEIDDLKGLNYQARFLDRRLTSELTEEDWVDIARDVKSRLTD